jgi:hypothetical protein
MAKLESDGCCAEFKFFVTNSPPTMYCDVFLRLSLAGRAFPYAWQFPELKNDPAAKYDLEPFEWWVNCDDAGTGYVHWIEKALAGEIAELETLDEEHFGWILPDGGDASDLPENRYFTVVVGIDRFHFIDSPEAGLGAKTGPSMTLLVTGVELADFHKQMLQELEPQWRKYVEFETWRDLI